MAMMKAMEEVTVPEQKRKATPPLLEKKMASAILTTITKLFLRNNFQNNPRSGQRVMGYGGDGSLPSFPSLVWTMESNEDTQSLSRMRLQLVRLEFNPITDIAICKYPVLQYCFLFPNLPQSCLSRGSHAEILLPMPGTYVSLGSSKETKTHLRPGRQDIYTGPAGSKRHMWSSYRQYLVVYSFCIQTSLKLRILESTCRYYFL